MLINLMEGDTITTNTLISSIKKFNSDGKEHGTIKALLKNFILPETEMAIKENQNNSNKYIYTVPVKPPLPTLTERMKSINDAKQAFLNSTVSSTVAPTSYETKTEKHTVHYAQIAITTESEDPRSTGGGRGGKHSSALNNNEYSIPVNVSPSIKKTMDPHQRKVSFKIKTAATSHKRPPLAKTMTITSSNVAELTKKFNNLQTETHIGSPKQSKLAKTLEELQSASRCSVSNSSTPSSTLSSSPNIKIVLRQRRGSKKRNNRKRCSSMDSMDDLLIADSSNKIRIIRSKSDGTKMPKTSKKRLKYQDSSEQPSGSDSVDGSPVKVKEVESKKDAKPVESTVVKNVIKKFECEITAQTNSSNTLKRQPDKTKSTTPVKEKPKVPEKKSSLVLTKNLVVKDGIPKIKTIKPVPSELAKLDKITNQSPEIVKRKEPLYDRKRYKTNYIHSENLPLKVVEIIPEDIHESNTVTVTVNNEQKEEVPNISIVTPNESEKVYQEINSPITPNESFLWRRKSSTQIYSDSEKSDYSYSFVSVTTNGTTISCSDEPRDTAQEESQVETNESQANISTCKQQSDPNLDFESNLVEACNKEIIVGFTSKPKQEEVEDYYEPLEPRDDENIIIIPIKSVDRTSKINCPLPEIPKVENDKNENESTDKDNIYQCLLEMRSHPEGDESSLHNYELCDNDLEERTRGDGDSDDGYEYCKSPPIKPYCLTSSSGIQIAEDYQPFAKNNNKNYAISKSVSGASTVSYEKIGPASERIYEKIPARPPKSKESSPTYSSRHSFISDYTVYNENENIYDTIKHGDATSLSHCYESIPNSPSMVKLRNDMRKQAASNVQKRLSFDTVSNISQSTMSSEQKTNSLYGQRSVISYNGQEIAFQVPSSETSVSDRSDRSDDWVDVSDEEKNEQKIIIVRERSRGRKSPISWSQKVRHQWQKSPKPNSNDKVFVTSPTKVYIDTSAKCSYYSENDEHTRRPWEELGDRVRLIDVLERTCWLNIRTVLQDGEIEIQDLIAFFECDSSDSGHLYESLEPAPAQPHPPHAPPPLPLEEDFDSFDSDSDTDDHDKSTYAPAAPTLPASRLPNPPTGGGQYTLTKIASAAQRKMRQIKRNLTKRYSVAMDGKPFTKPNNQTTIYDTPKKTSPIYANCEQHDPVYTNINFNDTRPVLIKTEIPMNKIYGSLKEELKTVISDKRASNGDLPPPLPEKPPPEKTPPEKPVTPTSEASKKDSGTLSRKAYFSFKSRFRRATSLAVDINSDIPSALKITNSTFYLTDSMDGDSGFSNCSDNGQPGSTETLSPSSGGKRRDGRRRLADSSPCLCPARPALPPPPPPPAPPAPLTPPLATSPPATDFSAVNEELKRLLPTLSRKDKSPRARTSWYAECGADTTPNTSANTTPNTSNTSWYAEAGLYQAGNISSSSGASSGSHPASPLPHSLFTHEPLYQFYNAAKVESVCRETGDSDSDAYDPGSQRSTTTSVSETSAPSRPSAMALVAPRGPSRTLWCEVPEVLNSTVLSSLAPAQKRLQEAKFELLTSEASYLNSLNVLEANFIAHPAFRDPHVVPRNEWDTLFATILPVRKCSQLLMNELEKCWQDNILLQGICDIVRQHAEQHFNVYVKYCENQALMVKALQRLQARPAFANALKKLESHPSCQSLSLHSFLMLPMQRVTRLPLLLDAVLKNLNSEDLEYHACARALVSLNNYVSQCNEGARNTERIEEMYRLCKIIEFPPHIRDAPSLGPACSKRDQRPIRWLVRSGEMTQLIWKSDELKLTFGKKFHKLPLHLFLFNDLLVIAKKKSEELYVCVDYCARSLLEVCASDVATATAKHALLITLLENHEGRTLEMLMSCPSETEWSRWSEALLPPSAGAEGEAVYAGWDCPQVCALYAYAPAQPDELGLAEGDVVNVTRKTSEGWYYGERTRDGEAGWFPGAYTAEIASPHVRARNLRQRYRLLALSGTYLGQKKRTHV